jgi:hypothetical protein
MGHDPDPAYARLLAESFARLTGRDLGDPWTRPDPIVSHGVEADPIFRWANPAALALWEMGWDAFTRLPSRQSAADAPDVQADRARLLAKAREQGWVTGYRGIRVSATGRRFAIDDTVLWTVRDAAGVMHGQAALICRVDRLD